MPRPRKYLPSPAPTSLPAAGEPNTLALWAEMIGEALGKGVARGISAGFTNGVAAAPAPAPAVRRGRPPKSQAGELPPFGHICEIPGCSSPMRSKGLCSRHYQAMRRGALKR